MCPTPISRAVKRSSRERSPSRLGGRAGAAPLPQYAAVTVADATGGVLDDLLPVIRSPARSQLATWATGVRPAVRLGPSPA